LKFEIEKRKRKTNVVYPKKELEIAREFAERAYREFGTFIKALVVFGSAAERKRLAKEADIDVLLILDDVSIVMTRELTQTYRIIIEKILGNMKHGNRLHVQSMKFSSFWEYIRAGDPIAINILRYGISLIDTGVFDPLQMLLDNGRIRPSLESTYSYYAMAPASITRAKNHVLNAVIDLYWASIDATHAALMSLGFVPPTPEHASVMLEKVLVKRGLLKKRHVKIMKNNYELYKGIVHRKIKEIDGKDFDIYKKQTIELINEIRKILEKKKK